MLLKQIDPAHRLHTGPQSWAIRTAAIPARHALPDGFHRIRHYGFLANRRRAEKLALCRTVLAVADAAVPIDSGGGEALRQFADPAHDPALVVVGGCSRSARSRNRGPQPPRPGTTPHDRHALADNHHDAGPDRDGDRGDEFLRRERHRHTDFAADVALQPLARRCQAAVRRCSANSPRPATRRNDRRVGDRHVPFPISPRGGPRFSSIRVSTRSHPAVPLPPLEPRDLAETSGIIT